MRRFWIGPVKGRTTRPILGAGAVAAAGLFDAAPVLAQGCAMCQTLTGNDEPLAKALNVSILFLLAMPFLMAGSVGAWFVYMYRGHRSAASEPQMVHIQREERT